MQAVTVARMRFPPPAGLAPDANERLPRNVRGGAGLRGTPSAAVESPSAKRWDAQNTGSFLLACPFVSHSGLTSVQHKCRVSFSSSDYGTLRAWFPFPPRETFRNNACISPRRQLELMHLKHSAGHHQGCSFLDHLGITSPRSARQAILFPS